MSIRVPIGGQSATRQGAELVEAVRSMSHARNAILAVAGRAGAMISTPPTAEELADVQALFGLSTTAETVELMGMFDRLNNLELLAEINRIIPV